MFTCMGARTSPQHVYGCTHEYVYGGMYITTVYMLFWVYLYVCTHILKCTYIRAHIQVWCAWIVARRNKLGCMESNQGVLVDPGWLNSSYPAIHQHHQVMTVHVLLTTRLLCVCVYMCCVQSLVKTCFVECLQECVPKSLGVGWGAAGLLLQVPRGSTAKRGNHGQIWSHPQRQMQASATARKTQTASDKA
jgi:hypothetical protein